MIGLDIIGLEMIGLEMIVNHLVYGFIFVVCRIYYSHPLLLSFKLKLSMEFFQI